MATTARGPVVARAWEVVLLCLVAVAWAAASVLMAVPLAIDLARGAEVSASRGLVAVAVLLLPPIAILLFFMGRLSGRGGWRWAAPIIVAVPLAVAVAPRDVSAPLSPMAALAPPTATPLPPPTPTPESILPGLLPIPIPKISGLSPTREPGPTSSPEPGRRLSADQARERVKESVGQCLLLSRELDRAEVTFEAPDWVVKLPLTRATWRVNDATGAVTPDEIASIRQRECRLLRP